MTGNAFTVHGRHVVVVGAARSGIAAAELLARRGARVTLSDTRESFDGDVRLRDKGIALELGGNRASTLASADLVVVSPGVPLDLAALGAARDHGVPIIGELELAWRWVSGRVIAVTGTKGKSTTTTVIGRMLAEAGRPVLVGGNIGVPLSAQVDASTPQTVHVVEVSSFQLETTATFRPWIAAWLNLAADHLDRHTSLEAYAAAKSRVFANQEAGDVAVINADDARVVREAAVTRAARVLFSPSGRLAEGFTVDGDWIVRRTTTGATPLVPISAIELAGRHMVGNVVAAVAVAWVAGVEPASMVAALRGFTGLAHVMEPVGTIAGVRFVNDSKATNVEAAARSIESFPGGVVAIIGGRFKGGDLRDLRAPLAAHGRGVVAVGEAAPLVREAIEGVVPIADAASMDDAVASARAMAGPDGVVLLAPACASFDWFRDYAARGDAFRDAVQRLAEQEQGREQ